MSILFFLTDFLVLQRGETNFLTCFMSLVHGRGSRDFFEGQIEILKKEMQCMSKGFIEERKVFQREMQEFYQNCQLQLKEQIREQNRRVEQVIREQFNTLISVNHLLSCCRITIGNTDGLNQLFNLLQFIH